jgi:predicted patatin/cPLA2 family phospholipase
MGYDKIVVVLTQPFGYEKKELELKELKNSIKKYKKYPYFVKALFDRPTRYNETLKNIKELEKAKRIFVIRPSESVEINPIKKTQKELQNVYDLGKKDMDKLYSRLINYLKK